MLGTLTPLAARAGTTRPAYRNGLKLRQMQVNGTEIVLRDTASAYLIDLSDKDGGSLAYTLNTSQTDPDNHEVASFEIALVTPAENPPAISFPFISKWADFAGLWRIRPGRIYFINVFRAGNGNWIGSVQGEVRLRTKRNVLGRTAAAAANIELEDNTQTYTFTAAEDTAFTFDTAGLRTEKPVLCFDLIVTAETDRPALTFPVSGWFDFGYPARPIENGTRHAFTFLSIDGGETWVGRYNTKL